MTRGTGNFGGPPPPGKRSARYFHEGEKERRRARVKAAKAAKRKMRGNK